MDVELTDQDITPHFLPAIPLPFSAWYDAVMYTIGELAKRCGVRTSALRYYEAEGLLAPAGRTESGYRQYDDSAERTLRFILRAQRLGFSLADIRRLLERIGDGRLRQGDVIQTAESRYLEIEKQITELLVLRHEMGMFLQDLHQRNREVHQSGPSLPGSNRAVGDALFEQLVERVCANPGANNAAPMLEWLLHTTGCPLSGDEAQRLLEHLRGRHLHIWQDGGAYHILVASKDPQVGKALNELAQLEARCQIHQQTRQIPHIMHDEEGYLLVAHGDNAFVFARLFLSIAA